MPGKPSSRPIDGTGQPILAKLLTGKATRTLTGSHLDHGQDVDRQPSGMASDSWGRMAKLLTGKTTRQTGGGICSKPKRPPALGCGAAKP